MNELLVMNFNSGPKVRRDIAVKGFGLNTHSSHQNNNERQPLIAADSCSDSDEEIVLHDVRFLNGNRKIKPEVSSLRKIKKKALGSNGEVTTVSSDPFRNCEFLHLEITESDSLQSISIKYQCSISNIKRANNLISDQEFYALKTLKIPVKKHSLLSEILPQSPVSSEISSSATIREDNDAIRTINIGIGASSRCPSPKDSAMFFRRMDEDLVKIMLSTNSQKDSLEAAAAALTTPRIQPLVKDSYSELQWNYLITFLVIVCVVVPTIVFLYMYIRSSHEHHDTGATTVTFETISELSLLDKR